jgi:hypothetical protein
LLYCYRWDGVDALDNTSDECKQSYLQLLQASAVNEAAHTSIKLPCYEAELLRDAVGGVVSDIVSMIEKPEVDLATFDFDRCDMDTGPVVILAAVGQVDTPSGLTAFCLARRERVDLEPAATVGVWYVCLPFVVVPVSDVADLLYWWQACSRIFVCDVDDASLLAPMNPVRHLALRLVQCPRDLPLRQMEWSGFVNMETDELAKLAHRQLAVCTGLLDKAPDYACPWSRPTLQCLQSWLPRSADSPLVQRQYTDAQLIAAQDAVGVVITKLAELCGAWNSNAAADECRVAVRPAVSDRDQGMTEWQQSLAVDYCVTVQPSGTPPNATETLQHIDLLLEPVQYHGQFALLVAYPKRLHVRIVTNVPNPYGLVYNALSQFALHTLNATALAEWTCSHLDCSAELSNTNSEVATCLAAWNVLVGDDQCDTAAARWMGAASIHVLCGAVQSPPFHPRASPANVLVQFEHELMLAIEWFAVQELAHPCAVEPPASPSEATFSGIKRKARKTHSSAKKHPQLAARDDHMEGDLRLGDSLADYDISAEQESPLQLTNGPPPPASVAASSGSKRRSGNRDHAMSSKRARPASPEHRHTTSNDTSAPKRSRAAQTASEASPTRTLHFPLPTAGGDEDWRAELAEIATASFTNSRSILSVHPTIMPGTFEVEALDHRLLDRMACPGSIGVVFRAWEPTCQWLTVVGKWFKGFCIQQLRVVLQGSAKLGEDDAFPDQMLVFPPEVREVTVMPTMEELLLGILRQTFIRKRMERTGDALKETTLQQCLTFEEHCISVLDEDERSGQKRVSERENIRRLAKRVFCTPPHAPDIAWPADGTSITDAFAALSAVGETALASILRSFRCDSAVEGLLEVQLRPLLPLLKPSGWLCDHLISMYLEALYWFFPRVFPMLWFRHCPLAGSPLLDTPSPVTPLFLDWLAQATHVPSPSNTTFAMYIAPANIGNFHWVLSVVDNTTDMQYSIDSLGGGSSCPDHERNVAEIARITGKTLMAAESRVKGGIQENPYDCGVFTCLHATMLALGFPASELERLGKHKKLPFRGFMLALIMHWALQEPEP